MSHREQEQYNPEGALEILANISAENAVTRAARALGQKLPPKSSVNKKKKKQANNPSTAANIQ